MSKCVEHTQKGIGLGYGTTRFEGRTFGLHRAVYCKYHNLKREHIVGLVIRHSCDNPRCINPEHLLLGTHQDNMSDRQSRNRQARQQGEFHGGAVLSTADVKYIREHYVAYCREFGGGALGRKYGVTYQTIFLIVHNKRWKHTNKGVTNGTVR